MHEQEKNLATDQVHKPVRITEKVFQNLPSKTLFIGTATATMLTASACTGERFQQSVRETTNALCGGLTIATLTAIYYTTQIYIPGKVNEAKAKINFQKLLESGNLDEDDWYLKEYARRLHRGNVNDSIREIENYQPSIFMRFAIYINSDSVSQTNQNSLPGESVNSNEIDSHR